MVMNMARRAAPSMGRRTTRIASSAGVGGGMATSPSTQTTSSGANNPPGVPAA